METKKRSRRGGGHLYLPKRKCSDGTYRESSIWWMVYYANGKRIAEGTGTRNKAQASKLLNDRMNRVSRGEPAELLARKLTFDDLERIVRNHYIASGNKSLSRLEASLKHLREHFGGRLASQITEAAVNGYVVARRKEPHHQGVGASRQTVNNELACLRLAFNLARVPYKPTIRTPDPKNARKGFLDRDALEAICVHLPPHLQPVIKIGFLTGWRVKSELLTRQWKHVDFNAGWLRLESGETKNGKAREFPIDAMPELREILERQREKAKLIRKATGSIVPWLFFRSDGRQIRDYRGGWRKACKRSGYEGRLVHDLRRSAVRSLEAANVSRSNAMALTGHLTMEVYQRYAITDQASLQDAARKLSAYHDAQRKQLASTGSRVSMLPIGQEREASQAR